MIITLNRDPQVVTNAINLAHKKVPDMRLGQLIYNAVPSDVDLFMIENDVLAYYILVFIGLADKR